MIWSTNELSEALGVNIPYNINANAVQFNSLDVNFGDLFIALQGNNDGHLYAIDAINKGASTVIVDHKIQDIPDDKQIIVNNTKDALIMMAKYKQKQSKAKFIGVTGSAGKTSTKEFIKTMLTPFGKVFASRGTFNNELGLLINLASMSNNAQYAVFELGMNHSGEIRNLVKLISLDIAIITLVSEAHLEFFNSVEEIVDAKCEIFEGLKKGGKAIINRSSPYYTNILKHLQRLNIKSVYTFGTIESDSYLNTYQKIDNNNIHLEYIINNKKISTDIAFKPRHHAENLSISLLVLHLLDLDLEIASRELKNINIIDGRGKLINAKFGNKNCKIISDYYNANPTSMKAAFEYLKDIDCNKKIAIIGDMLELGSKSIELHQSIVPSIIASKIHQVILVGSIMQSICNLLPKTIKYEHFDNVELLINQIHHYIDDDILILIKGSKSIGLKKILDKFQL